MCVAPVHSVTVCDIILLKPLCVSSSDDQGAGPDQHLVKLWESGGLRTVRHLPLSSLALETNLEKKGCFRISLQSATVSRWCVKGEHEMVCGRGLNASVKRPCVTDWSVCAVGCDTLVPGLLVISMKNR